jgi:hypothetical protein
LLAVDPLLRPLPAEPYVLGVHPGAAVEVVAVQPPQRALLHLRPALGHQPHPTVEPRHQSGDGLHRVGHLRRGEHRLVVAVEERGVATVRMGRSVDEDAADVDAESGFTGWTFHVSMIRPTAAEENYIKPSRL